MSLISKEILKSIVFDMDFEHNSGYIGMWPMHEQTDFICKVVGAMPEENSVAIHNEILSGVDGPPNYLDPVFINPIVEKLFDDVRESVEQDVSDIIFAHRQSERERQGYTG